MFRFEVKRYEICTLAKETERRKQQQYRVYKNILNHMLDSPALTHHISIQSPFLGTFNCGYGKLAHAVYSKVFQFIYSERNSKEKCNTHQSLRMQCIFEMLSKSKHRDEFFFAQKQQSI